MYTSIQPTTRKRIIFYVLLVLALAMTIISCKKNGANISSTADTVTADDAADAVTEAVTPESAGIVAQTQTTTVVIINENDLSCGVEKDTAFSGSSLSGAVVSYSYAYSSSRLLSCNNGLPSSFQFNFSGKTSYDAPRISSSDSTKAQFGVTGLDAGSSQYVFNAAYVRNGSETSKVHNQLSFTSTITITSTNLTINKSTSQIVSGTAGVSISGAATNGKSFSYSGTLTFKGSKQATLVLGNGNTYNITWS